MCKAQFAEPDAHDFVSLNKSRTFLAGKTEETIKRPTSMAALGRIGEPEDIARVVLLEAALRD
jgi:hypothetical protein